MKILLISDSHFENTPLKNITEKHIDKVDYFIHCGDSSLNADDSLLQRYLVVKGNHDNDSFKDNIIININQYRCLIIHGNNFDIYLGYEKLLDFIKKNNINICFHGHTHIPSFYHQDNIYIINPGSIMINRASYGFGTYAIVDINNKIDVKYYNSVTNEECSKQVLADGKNILQQYREIKRS